MFAANIPALHSSRATTSYYSSSSSKPKKEKQALRFDNFLCCLKLETGGLVIGWTSFILSSLLAIITLLFLIFLPKLSCEKLRSVCETATQHTICRDDDCSTVKLATIIFTIVGFFVCIILALIAAYCISGTLKRNHRRVKPMVILLAIATILGFLNILTFTSSRILLGLISGCINLYLFICIYSLFYKLRDEFERGLNVQSQPPVNKV